MFSSTTEDFLLELLERLMKQKHTDQSSAQLKQFWLIFSLSPVQLQSLHMRSAAAVGVRGRGPRAGRVGGRVGGGVRGLPQSVVIREQLAQVIPGEMSSPGSLAVRQSFLPQLRHLKTKKSNVTPNSLTRKSHEAPKSYRVKGMI